MTSYCALLCYIPEPGLEAGNVRGDRFVIGLKEGAGELEGVLGADADSVPGFKGFALCLSQGEFGPLKPEDARGPHRIPNQ